MVDSWYCLERVVPGGMSQVSRRSGVGNNKRRTVLNIGSVFKWVFYALLGTMSIVKLFNSFEYRKIPLYDALWRCPLYHSTIPKSWSQDLPVSTFELFKQVLLIRLRHSANEKLLKVYVPQSLDKSWLEELVLQKTILKRSENLWSQKKNQIPWRTVRRRKVKAKTPGSHR